MAISKKTIIQDIAVEPDGQLIVYEIIEYWEGGVANGVLEVTGPRTGRRIDVGDNVSAEDALIQDVANGNLHSPARKTVRDDIKAAEAAAAAKDEAGPPA